MVVEMMSSQQAPLPARPSTRSWSLLHDQQCFSGLLRCLRLGEGKDRGVSPDPPACLRSRLLIAAALGHLSHCLLLFFRVWSVLLVALCQRM